MTAPARPAPPESVDVGDLRITYLPDGDASVSAEAVFPAANQELWAAIATGSTRTACCC